MKKFFQKYDLVKISLIMILLAIVLSWVIPQSYFNGAELSVGEITRVGFFDIVTYGLLGMYYFTVLVTFLFVVGAFYQFLSKLGAYQKLTDKLAEKVKGKEILFSLIVSFVFAALASVLNEYMVLVAFMPFIITLCSKAKMDKISSFVMTFGAMLVGLLGSTLSQKVSGMNAQFFQLDIYDGILIKVIIFVLAFVIYGLFNVLYLIKVNGMSKKSKDKKISKKSNKKDNKKSNKKTEKVIVEKEQVDCADLFENEIKDNEKSNMIPLLIVGILSIITVILAYIPWSTFKVEWFTKALDTVTKVEVFGEPIFSFILGNVQAFGNWDLFGIQVVMILTMIVLAICYGKGLTDIIDSFANGFKKTAKLVVVLLLAYLILEFAVMYPVIPTIIGKIMGKTFNVFTTSLSAIITSLFTSEYQYTANLVYGFATAAYPKDLSAFTIIFQSIYGLVSFLAPSSAMLLVGLSYLDIPYKDWMKYIWKFFVAMLVVILVVALIIA